MSGVVGYRRSGTGTGSSLSYSSRPSPYERGDRYGGSRFQTRGTRSFKGASFSNSSSGKLIVKLYF